MAAIAPASRASINAQDSPLLTLVRGFDTSGRTKFLYHLVPPSHVPLGWVNGPSIFLESFRRAFDRKLLGFTWTNGFRFTRVVPIIIITDIAYGPPFMIFEDVPGTYHWLDVWTSPVWRMFALTDVGEILRRRDLGETVTGVYLQPMSVVP